MEINSLILFVIAALSINLIPGPDVIYIVSNTLHGKMRAGFKASLGLGVGYLVHTCAAVLGLSAMIVNSALLFMLVKYLGAAYLLYLGIQSLRGCYRNTASMQLNTDGSGTDNLFTQGVVVSVLNPKVAMFFLAFLPQFIDVASADASKQLLLLGVLFSVLATLCNLLYALLGHVVFSSPKAQGYTRMLMGVSGTLLVGLSAKIALSEK